VNLWLKEFFIDGIRVVVRWEKELIINCTMQGIHLHGQ